MELNLMNKQKIDSYFMNLSCEEITYLHETYFKKPKEAIKYTNCCKELPSKEDLSSLISKVTPIMEEEEYETEQIFNWVCAFKDGFRYGQKPKK